MATDPTTESVLTLISAVAAQTNLLALNATIEAARAGEAGRGLAVVAGEVKDLARETAQATGKIAQQISAIQADSREAADCVAQVIVVIDRINELQSAIAVAVEEQSAATAETAETWPRPPWGHTTSPTTWPTRRLCAGRRRCCRTDPGCRSGAGDHLGQPHPAARHLPLLIR